MKTYSLKVEKREVKGKKNNNLREKFFIPAVLYGPGIENQNLVMKKTDFMKIYNEAGPSSLIDLQVGDDKPVKVLIQDYQTDPRSSDITHIDFYQVQAGKKITTSVELEFIGEAPAVKELSGTLVKNYDEIEIECLLSDLEKLENVKVDLSVLVDFSAAIHVKDLPIPQGIKVLVNPNEVVALVMPVVEEKPEPVAPEMPGEVKAEGEAEAEGKEADGKEAKSGQDKKKE